MQFGGINFGGWWKFLYLAGINFGGSGKFLYLAGINFGGFPKTKIFQNRDTIFKWEKGKFIIHVYQLERYNTIIIVSVIYKSSSSSII